MPHVVLARHLRGPEDRMIDASTRRMNAAAADSLNEGFLWGVEENDTVQLLLL